jgi:hypothetical protein
MSLPPRSGNIRQARRVRERKLNREASMKVEAIVNKLDGVFETRNGWQGHCPAHDDRKASLSIGTDGGKTLLHCHAGCATEEVVRALGLQMRDLFSEEPEQLTVVATYNYRDENSKVRFQIVRYSPKAFRARRPDGNGGWVYSVEGIELIPYRLPTILKHNTVVIAAGEKDACTGGSGLHLPTTTNPFGEGAWRDEYSVHFAGKTVILCPDNDEAGRKHMQTVACSLFPVAKKIKIVELPFGKDLTEWHALGGTREQFIALAREASAVTIEQIVVTSLKVTKKCSSCPRLINSSAAFCESDWNG